MERGGWVWDLPQIQRRRLIDNVVDVTSSKVKPARESRWGWKLIPILGPAVIVLAAIAYLVVFGSVISFVAYLYALQKLPTAQVSIYAYINPVVAVLAGWLFFSEALTVFIIAGVLITLYGVYLVNQSVMKMK